jgi:hypothetical protein
MAGRHGACSGRGVNHVDPVSLAPSRAAPTPPHLPSRLQPVTNHLFARATSVAPLTGAALGIALLSRANPRSLRLRRAGSAALIVSSLAGILRWQFARAFTWQPPYRVEFDYGRLQIRRYAPQILAETTVEGRSWPDALDVGVTRLTDYLFGGNELEAKLPMSTPVLTSINAARRDLESWRPPSVTELNELNGPTSRIVALAMPSRLTLDDLPAPKDERVHLHGVPERRMAALCFRGSNTSDLPAQKRNELLFLLKCAGLRAASEVWFAGYDSPRTLPLLRRNEVLVELAE